MSFIYFSCKVNERYPTIVFVVIMFRANIWFVYILLWDISIYNSYKASPLNSIPTCKTSHLPLIIHVIFH